MKRSSGILLHPTSLPGNYYCGTLGRNAYRFVDFLSETGQSWWQMLPLGHVGFGNSPYMCYSAFAGNPLLIDPDLLHLHRLIEKHDLHAITSAGGKNVNFEAATKQLRLILAKAFQCFKNSASHELIHNYRIFLDRHAWWLNDYALFVALKEHHNQLPWTEWETKARNRDKKQLEYYRHKLNNTYEFQRFIQFLFFWQWDELKSYAESRGIGIIGDIPLYVAHDSVDVWANRDIFLLKKDGSPDLIGGVPPDYFNESGQLWGNPVYNWDALEKRNYDWWIARMHFNLALSHLVRIDHFRGFESFWAIDANARDAKKGKWMKANGKQLLLLLQQQIGHLPVIAEDLGEITPKVHQLRDTFNIPGMKILQFAYNSDQQNEHLIANHTGNFVAYTGTHDNDTSLGWYYKSTSGERRNLARFSGIRKRNFTHLFINETWASPAKIAITPIQDLLKCKSTARMNIPGTASENWEWRFSWKLLSFEKKAFLYKITKRHNRLNKVNGKLEKRI